MSETSTVRVLAADAGRPALLCESRLHENGQGQD